MGALQEYTELYTFIQTFPNVKFYEMGLIIRNRTIRPSTRLKRSKSYKIDTKSVKNGDTLVVNIDHESKPFQRSFTFNGSDVAYKNSISFRVHDYGPDIDITWSGAKPNNVSSTGTTADNPVRKQKRNTETKADNLIPKQNLSNAKASFKPISHPDTVILILGTIPGDKSIRLGEYYGHSANKFWKVISAITDNPLPFDYSTKKELLFRTKIGIWDVAHTANRAGSLDSAITNEEPNDLGDFISTHKNLKVIGFNGTKAEALFNKYFQRRGEIRYVSLPSTSPANTGTSFDNLCKKWRQLLNE